MLRIAKFFLSYRSAQTSRPLRLVSLKLFSIRPTWSWYSSSGAARQGTTRSALHTSSLTANNPILQRTPSVLYSSCPAEPRTTARAVLTEPRERLTSALHRRRRPTAGAPSRLRRDRAAPATGRRRRFNTSLRPRSMAQDGRGPILTSDCPGAVDEPPAPVTGICRVHGTSAAAGANRG